MLSKYHEHEEFKDFWTDQESETLYKILNDDKWGQGVGGHLSDRYAQGLAVAQQITPRQQVSPGSGFERPPFFANHRLQA